MKVLLLPCILLLFLSGCVGAPVGWGGSHNAILANDESVTYVYDRLMGGYKKIMSDATKHCKTYGKSPVPTVSGRDGVLWTQTFECK